MRFVCLCSTLCTTCHLCTCVSLSVYLVYHLSSVNLCGSVCVPCVPPVICEAVWVCLCTLCTTCHLWTCVNLSVYLVYHLSSVYLCLCICSVTDISATVTPIGVIIAILSVRHVRVFCRNGWLSYCHSFLTNPQSFSHWTYFDVAWKLNCSSVLTTDTAPVKRLYCCVTHFHFPAAFCCGCNLEVYRL